MYPLRIFHAVHRGTTRPAVVGIAALLLALLISGVTLVQAAPEASYDGNQHAGEGQHSPSASLSVTGNLAVHKWSPAAFGGVVAGGPITYTIIYSWDGAAAAPNVRIVDEVPAEIELGTIVPPPTTRDGNRLTWNLGTVSSTTGVITVEGTVRADTPMDTELINAVTITGDVIDTDPEDDVAEVSVMVVTPAPKLWLLKWGLMEEMEGGAFFTAERGVDTRFVLYYFNFSSFESPGTVLVDDLPAGVQFISAQPAQSSVSGQRVTWDLGTLPPFGFGEVQMVVRPNEIGNSLANTATISSTAEGDGSTDSATFTFSVVTLLPPRLLKPMLGRDQSSPMIVGPNPTFEGMAKAEATVTLYEGNAEGCWDDLAECDVTAIVSTTVGPDRRWSLTPTNVDEERLYPLYLRAEYDGQGSAPFLGIWEPYFLKVDPRFEEAGWDMDSFVIQSGDNEVRPGGVGGSSGGTPNESLTIRMRQEAPPTIEISPTLRAEHDIWLVTSDDGETISKTVPVSEVRRVTDQALQGTPEGPSPSSQRVEYDFIYVHKGFGAGSTVEIWCRPIYYSDDGIPLVGLVFVKCHEIIIDPAGYVYRIEDSVTYEWPEVPPSDVLIANATVTATARSGDNAWEHWPAEDTGQVNPQVTDWGTPDRINVEGYYAFYVPAGQYRVEASAPECANAISPILTVIDAPIFYNIGMHCTDLAQTGVSHRLFLPSLRR